MPSTQRLTTLTGATFAGVVATALFAAPAMACSADIKVHGNPDCDTTTGTFSVTWQLRNHDGITATLDNATFEVKQNGTWGPGTGSLVTTTVPASKQGQYVDIATQTGIPSGAKAKFTVHVVWRWDSDGRGHKAGDKAGEQTVRSSETLCGKCDKVTPTPTETESQSPTPTPTETQSQSPTPTPTETQSQSPSTSPSASPSATPSASGGAGGGPVSPSPSKSATSPALPVTGSQTGLYAGGAATLLGAGAGLFFLARRRRLKFEV
ncbi:LPXTG cell wall anchor domain-containing protein [Planosporangium thailandense]|uniref:LPXTG cell wall anchor domain-containing protein n=1 Tax=Planosporangium thailandense TaxID=765197 RepID=UPI00197C63D1|nr:LPXTG cell wall anchor domain-containing protein [Planosporangium thailandense]